jgi:hypothetical protein
MPAIAAMPAMAKMQAAAVMEATAVRQAAAVTPATSKSKDDSNSMTAYTFGTPTVAGMLAKLVKPATACREANNNMDTIHI